MTDSFDEFMKSFKAASAISSMDEISKQFLSSSYLTEFDSVAARATAFGTTSALDEAVNSIKSSALGGSISHYFDESISNYTSSLLNLTSHDELVKLASGVRSNFQEFEALTKASTQEILNLNNSTNLDIKNIADSMSGMNSFQSLIDSIVQPENFNIAIDVLKIDFTVNNIRSYENEVIEEQFIEVANSKDSQDFADKLKSLPDSIRAFLYLFLILVLVPIFNSITANLITPHVSTLLENTNKPEREQVKEISSLYHKDINLSQLRFVADNALNLRAKPKIKSEILDVLKLGQVLNVLRREKSWLEVSFTNEEEELITGWILGRYTAKFKYY